MRILWDSHSTLVELAMKPDDRHRLQYQISQHYVSFEFHSTTVENGDDQDRDSQWTQ